MSSSSIPLPPVLAALCVTLTIGLAACGGDDDSSDSAAEQTNAPAESEAPAGPKLDAVLSCLEDAGLAAEDQSSNTSGETIGIDYPGGRTVISFEKNEEDAELTLSVQPDPTADAYREGLIVVSASSDPAAAADRPAIETCITG